MAIVEGIRSTSQLGAKARSNRDSIRKWENTYRSAGIEGLLKEGRGGKRHGILDDVQKEKLQKKLSEPKEGFTSYKQATEWINETFEVEMGYHAVNKYLKRNFGAKLKIGRKTHINEDENATALLKKLSRELKYIKEEKFQSGVFKAVNIYFQDESRFGLLTIQRRILTLKGVKPLIPYQHKFKSLNLFGAYTI